ncbi:dihydrolipoamide acetyltransferase family protein [Cohnella silvisoli]|uniref:Dihydrolipoamide acetyltransferase component of pyruvate dehydrogenase complex n=1 Tax=Cohnella silvisoli TaxID=2873699 RepID=A0ABV1KYH9_9BACL|nr:dihydrolipoamide acetyltransferase family protein [Cohnella silvisoli]MCD9023843.1 2-oxo acid dehydrogenase subunit E2 [Cohnella silvisoli]
MSIEIRLPKMGLTMEEARIVTWEKQVGEYVELKEVVATIETDKATLEIESAEQGFLIEQRVKAGDAIAVGGIIGILSANQVSGDAIRSERIRVSPAARRLAGVKGIVLSEVDGTGPDGRIVLRDIIGAPVTIESSGSSTEREAPRDTAFKKPLSAMRKIISERLTYSFREIPQFQVKSSVNLFHVLKIREILVNSVEETAGVRLSVLDFIIQAVGLALRQVPQVNVSFCTDPSGSYILEHQEVNIGLAVSVQEGLVVPVIRDADQLSLVEIAKQRHALVSQAKAGTLSVGEMTGGTFTISSLASFDIAEFTALINPPEAGILAVGMARKVPVVVGDAIEVATMMDLNASFDHRPLDGADGAKFMQLLSQQLQSDRWKLV